MAQYDIHRFRRRSATYKYVLVVQNDFLDHLDVRLVIPAVTMTGSTRPLRRLNPLIDIEGQPHYLRTQEMAAVRLRLLGDVVGSAKIQSAAIISAIDMLITG